jgi:hypothetical protein
MITPTTFSRPRAYRLAWIAALAIGLIVLPNLRLSAKPVPAVVWSVPLAQTEVAVGGEWESAPIDAEVTLVGMSWEGTPPEAAWVRTDDGSGWSRWYELAIEAEHGPDPASDEAATARRASEPLYVGEVQRVQYRVTAPSTDGVEAELVETSARHLSAVERVSHFFSRLTWSAPEAGAAPGQPDIVPRSVWGGDTCTANKDEEPAYNPGVQALFVHHTASSNTYSAAGAADAVYATCSYHVNANGWKDIGYNFVIDRFGTIYEGREGGIEESVYGAHTGGFNYYSTGVALLGNHDTAAVSQASIDALVELAAWKLDLHHVDPSAVIDMVSLGSSKYEEGVVVQMPTIAGHKDASSTSCPGSLCYPLLPDIRTQVYAAGGAKIFGGGPDVVPPPLDEPATFPFSFSEPSTWHFTLTDPNGDVALDESGSGSSGSVTWDGQVDGGPAPRGQYTISLTAATDDDGESPRPVDQILTWYNPPFADDDFNLHEANINAIAAAGITRGCSDIFAWRFCPDDHVPRDQMASFIARALALPAATEDYFGDDNGNTHEDAINALAEAGIAAGCAEGRYCPSLTVTRAQMATFLFRAMGLSEVDEDFFADDTGSVHEASINAVAAAQVTLGCGEGLYCPLGAVSRDQMASFLARAFVNEEN